jgi:hypothetical protein
MVGAFTGDKPYYLAIDMADNGEFKMSWADLYCVREHFCGLLAMNLEHDLGDDIAWLMSFSFFKPAAKVVPINMERELTTALVQRFCVARKGGQGLNRST